MEKKTFSTLLICLLIFTGAICTISCGNNDDSETNIVNPIDLTMTISYPKSAKLDNITEESFRVEEGSTVTDALQLYCNISDISTTMDTTSGLVTSISSVHNGDIKEKATWKFKINGKLIEKSPSEVTLKDGDFIECIYK